MDGKKTLVTINTFKRVDYLKLFMPDYLSCKNRHDLNLIVSLDGNNPEILQFCKKNNVPVIFSDVNQGIGIAKNRVLYQFPEMDYYFFLDDDVELINCSAFTDYIMLAEKHNLHHISSGESVRFFELIKEEKFSEYSISYYKYGSGAFNFFTRKGLEIVGGWHTEFAKYKRFGHTEHSYRFFHNEMSKGPFVYVHEFEHKYFRWHNPPTLINSREKILPNRLAEVEAEVMSKKLKYFKIDPLGEFNFSQSEEKINLKCKYKPGVSLFKKIKNNPFLKEDEKEKFIYIYSGSVFSVFFKAYLYILVLGSQRFGSAILKMKHLFLITKKYLRTKQIGTYYSTAAFSDQY